MKAFFSFYTDALKIALQSIFAHKLRAFLTLIGIIIGVASVVTVGASISGLNTYVVEKVTKVLGSNHFMIARMAFQEHLSDDEFERRNRRNKRLNWDDYEWVRDHCATCSEVGAEVGGQVDLKQDGIEFPGALVFGASANMVDIEDKTIERGRFISNDEVQRSALVCVLGGDIKDKFFPFTDAIGKTLKVRGLPMQVVGVEEKRGSMFGDSFDRHIYIPVSTHLQIFGRNGLQIHGSARNREAFQATIEDARVALRNKHRLNGNEEDDFGIVNVEELNNQIDQFTSSIAMVVVPITFITLLVGGIVVMNIMLVSVTERTFEVGLRKAVGATRRQILAPVPYRVRTSLRARWRVGIAAGMGRNRAYYCPRFYNDDDNDWLHPAGNNRVYCYWHDRGNLSRIQGGKTRSHSRSDTGGQLNETPAPKKCAWRNSGNGAG